MSENNHGDASVKSSSVPEQGKPFAPPESPAETLTRRVILASFWAVVIFLGLPHWLWTTSVHRAELDIQTASKWIEGRGCGFRIPFNINVDSDLPATTQQDFVVDLATAANANSQEGIYQIRVTTPQDESAIPPDLTVRLQRSARSGASSAELQKWGSELLIQCPDLDGAGEIASCAGLAASKLDAIIHDEHTSIAYTLHNSDYRDIINFELGDTTQVEKRFTRAFKYASSYHLTFSMFVASSAPSAWDIEAALNQYIQPLLDSLSGISGFTVDTQVQLFSSLSPSMAGPTYDEERKAWILSQADLSGFINAAEWPLSPSIDSGPTIHFVLYIPPADKSPLLVTDSTLNSWIIPQWGGVQILNRELDSRTPLSAVELESIMYSFADQLTSLIGLPPMPHSLDLRIKALTRQRIASLIVSASSTLGALVRLTQKLEQIAIPESVAQAVSNSVFDLEQACTNLESGLLHEALTHARRADEAVEKAFFEPSMVGQVYFPDEHKVAVYVPLLGPMAVPLIMATIKEIRQFRQRKIKTS